MCTPDTGHRTTHRSHSQVGKLRLGGGIRLACPLWATWGIGPATSPAGWGLTSAFVQQQGAPHRHQTTSAEFTGPQAPCADARLAPGYGENREPGTEGAPQSPQAPRLSRRHRAALGHGCLPFLLMPRERQPRQSPARPIRPLITKRLALQGAGSPPGAGQPSCRPSRQPRPVRGRRSAECRLWKPRGEWPTSPGGSPPRAALSVPKGGNGALQPRGPGPGRPESSCDSCLQRREGGGGGRVDGPQRPPGRPGASGRLGAPVREDPRRARGVRAGLATPGAASLEGASVSPGPSGQRPGRWGSLGGGSELQHPRGAPARRGAGEARGAARPL